MVLAPFLKHRQKLRKGKQSHQLLTVIKKMKLERHYQV